MTKVKTKPVLGWGFVDSKGKLAPDSFKTRSDADGYYSDGDYKLVRVQLTKYVAKKK